MNYRFAGLGPLLQGVSLLALLGFALVGVGLVVFLAGLPGRIATHRRHPYAAAVGLCGWLGILIGIPWFVAIVWAYMTPSDTTACGPADAKLESELERLEAAVRRLKTQLSKGKP